MIRKIYFLIFWIPSIVSLVLLLAEFYGGDLGRRSGILFFVWFLLALILQIFSSSWGIWASGLAMQSILAIVLILRLKLNM
jgi:hypothetical protein